MADTRRLILTGASGFLGRHLLANLKESWRIFGLARRSQVRCGAPFHPNISWFQVDIGDRERLGRVFRRIREAGGADYLIHLAAHYDFTGEDDPEYWRTNVDGLRNVLEESRGLGLKRFVFASSVAACSFPPPGGAVTEDSPPDGEHIYAVTKRIGEQMLGEYEAEVPSCIVRFAALFSDWCEYAPLYQFFNTWLSSAWNSRILAGRGCSSIPYLHVRDAAVFLRRLLEQAEEVGNRQVLVCSTDGAVRHRDLFREATLEFFGEERKPLMLPRSICRFGVWSRDLMGRILGNRPFERPWMVRYIDRELVVDSSRTRELLDWAPRERLEILRRMPFLMENLKVEPVEWHRRNRAAMKQVDVRSNLLVYKLLEKYQDQIREQMNELLAGSWAARNLPSYHREPADTLGWRHTVALRHLMNAVRTGERSIFMSYCRDLAERRKAQGLPAREVCNALEALHQVCLTLILQDPEAEGLDHAIHDYVTMTYRFGCDQVQDVYDGSLVS